MRILNYAAEGRCFHTLVVLHPVFETVGGAFRFSLGLQVEFDFGDEDGVVERIVALERTLALMPRTLDGSHEVDRQRLAGASLLRRGEAGSASAARRTPRREPCTSCLDATHRRHARACART